MSGTTDFGGTMNKSDLIDAVAKRSEVTKTLAAQVVDAVLATVTETLGTGEDVALSGFGTFAVIERPERQARNPRTGESVTVAAGKVVKFKPGKGLKDTVA
jgi:DNA-binding protein HU-beta